MLDATTGEGWRRGSLHVAAYVEIHKVYLWFHRFSLPSSSSSSSSCSSIRAHAAELGNPIPEEPLIFLKPTTSYVQEGGAIEVCTMSTLHSTYPSLIYLYMYVCNSCHQQRIDYF